MLKPKFEMRSTFTEGEYSVFIKNLTWEQALELQILFNTNILRKEENESSTNSEG